MSCCHCESSNKFFDETHARADLKRYRKKGPDNTTRFILSGVSELNPKGKTLLDIGGGVGILQLELFKEGISTATIVDHSPAYRGPASRAAEELGREKDIAFHTGDFVDMSNDLDVSEIVTMDRVICCYPHREKLLNAALSRCRTIFAQSYPRDVWYVRWVIALKNLHKKLIRSDFKLYVHSPVLMESQIVQAGFHRTSHRRSFVWEARVYCKDSDAGAR